MRMGVNILKRKCRNFSGGGEPQFLFFKKKLKIRNGEKDNKELKFAMKNR